MSAKNNYENGKTIFFNVVVIGNIAFIKRLQKNNCTAGGDGSIVIKANMLHHTRGIKGAILRIKYCDQDLPGESASDYDLNIKGSDADTFVIATGLKAGDYFFFGNGYDSLIFQPVKGGQPFTLNETSDTVKLNVYITEGD